MARANKRLTSRFYQLKAGHCLAAQYLAWTTRRPGAGCWWCQYKIQSREHLYKNCPQWKSQQKTLWATALKETRKLRGQALGRGCTKDRGAVRRRAVLICSLQQTSGGRQGHRWQKTQEQRPARRRSGTSRECEERPVDLKEEEERLWVEE